MQPLDHNAVKHSYSARAVPPEVMAGIVPCIRAPQIGDLIVVEVLQINRHDKIESRVGMTRQLFPGSRFVGTYGNRYATDQYEGYVPREWVGECDQLSVGGLCGEVASRFDGFAAPTRLRVVGAVGDAQGRPLNTRLYGLAPLDAPRRGEVILVIGATMNSGKTTTVGTLARALAAAGQRVAAAKVTGTAAGRDGRYYADCGAEPVLDFTVAGYPSTYLLGRAELLTIYRTLATHLRADDPDYILIEIADGIFQRETRMLLEDAAFRASIDHVFFAATDSLAAECGVRYARSYGLPLRAVTGTVTRSPLAIGEAEAVTGVACMTVEQLMSGAVLPLLQGKRAANVGLPVSSPAPFPPHPLGEALVALDDR